MSRIATTIAATSIILASFALWPGAAIAQEMPITAEVDRTSVSIDEVFTLTVTVTGSSGLPTPAVWDFSGVDVNILSKSTASQLNIRSNQTSAKIVIHYRLQPTDSGTLIIGPITIVIDGQAHSTEPITVEVNSGIAPSRQTAPPSQPSQHSSSFSAPETFFVEVEVDNAAPYLGQQVVYVFRYFRATAFAGRLTYEAPGFTGFWHEELTEQRQYDEWLADRRYRVFEMRTLLFPTVTGPATIAPTVFNLPRAFRTRRQLTSDTVSLDVRPLPAGAPDSFSGAVGWFDISSSVDVTDAAVNEPVTLTVILLGAGNIETLAPPDLPVIPLWRAFDSATSVNTQVSDGKLMGSRAYERIFVPSAEGEYVIPPISYSYFDLEDEVYRTVSTDPITVNISPGKAESPFVPLPGGTRDEIERLATDIRHIKPAPQRLESAQRPLTEQTAYWLAWSLPLLVLLAGAGWKLRARLEIRGDEQSRGLNARDNALEQLTRARVEQADPYTAASSALIAYIGDTLDYGVSGLTHDALAALLSERGIDASLVERVEACLVSSEGARFGPGGVASLTGEALLDEAEDLISSLDRGLEA